MIRVLLVDDHTMVRAGLARLLEQTGEIEVAATADRGEAAISLDTQLKPDVILMDVSMPGMSGIATTKQICTNRPDARVLILTASTDKAQVLRALDAGAAGYLVKDSDPATLIEGVLEAVNGNAPLDPRAGRALLDARAPNRPVHTARETEVLTCIAEGLPNKAIASRLEISEKTVKAHLTRIFAVLGVTDRTQAALWAHDHVINGQS